MDLKRDISILAALMVLLLVGMSGGESMQPASLNAVEAHRISTAIQQD